MSHQNNYIQLIVFDLDGVLVETRPLHFLALNQAIEQVAGPSYKITDQEHHSQYDGRPTSIKLHMLSEQKGLPIEKHEKIWQTKQILTHKLIQEQIQPHQEMLTRIIPYLKSQSVNIVCASNSIRSSLDLMLTCLGIETIFDKTYSCEDVKKPKPHPEMYLRIILDFGLKPHQVMVIEDSHLGRQAASEAGCHVAPLDQPASLTLEWIQKHLDWCNSYQLQTNRNEIPWLLTPLMNIVVPMSGKGSRFKEKGYDVMKPLLPVHGKPMIQAVIQNIQVHGHYSFICQKSHVDQYKLDFLLPMMLSDTQNQTAHIFTVDQITRGATESVLQAKTQINNEQPLIILNSDQWIEWDMHGFLYKMMSSEIDGGILVFEDHSGSYLEPGLHGSSKWSYAAQDEKTGWVTEIKEKVPISKWATVGLYYWKRGSDFVKYAEKMIEQDQRVNNEFYVAPVYNLAIQDGFKIALYECQKMYGLGTPEDYESFLKTCPYRIFG